MIRIKKLDKKEEIRRIKIDIEYYEKLAVVEGSYNHHRRDEALDGLYKKLKKLKGDK